MNKVILMGRLTKDPDISMTNSGRKYLRFTLAINRYNSDADFINCVAWENIAETISKYVRKGQQLAIEGNIKVSKYTTQNNENRYNTDVIVERIHLISNNNQNTNSNDRGNFNKNESNSSFITGYDEDDSNYDDIDDSEPFPF